MTNPEKDLEVIEYLGLCANYPVNLARWYEKYNPFFLRKELDNISGMALQYIKGTPICSVEDDHRHDRYHDWFGTRCIGPKCAYLMGVA